MIQYSLKCSEGHSFDSWFQSAAAYDKLAASGMVSCAVCGGSRVEKAIMTPRVRPARSAAETPATERPLSAPATPAEQALAEMRRKIEQNSDYVGRDFASEARRMHLGETPERSIYGEARIDEAKALIEEGIPVAPLPFLPNRKAN
ncbi:DUF1178 family protein [Ruegeria marina]|uniref:DUF1178 family protein n=1 Tax=Ruegeria marina TaxID=639004 RepID=A0A1G6TT54_9RHOB|nr:DUF1178 family protein [Ruegeria marina]SDD32094.1 hypothetical protein SAMN04488239_106175 [Ruegeria marina]